MNIKARQSRQLRNPEAFHAAFSALDTDRAVARIQRAEQAEIFAERVIYARTSREINAIAEGMV
jgi:hypothetical protein